MSLFKRVTDYPAKHVKLIDIDFNKPWWHVFLQQKGKIFAVIISTIVFNVLNTLFPLLIGWALETQSIYNLAIIITLFLIEECSSWFIWNPKITQLYSQTIESFRYNAYHTLLSIDPMYHAQQSSGVGIGKIRRTMDAYRYMTKNLFDEIIPVFISLLTTVITFITFNLYLGVSAGIGMICVSTFFAWQVIEKTHNIETQANYDDDQANHIGTESLIQATFIRSAFASNQVDRALAKKHLKVSQSMTKLFMSYRFMRSLFILTYTLGIGCITAFLLYLVNKGSISTTIATSLVLTFLRSTQPLLKIDARVRETVSAYRKIEDFYRFIRRFGKRTFPVFPHQITKKPIPTITPKESITLEVKNITVAYPHHKPIFSNLSLNIQTAQSEPNKMYGIIGPSGIGKTTLVSLIGGLLKPPIGEVLINGYDIYELSDRERQQLIALQGQTATSLHGKLKHSLTFGLPYEHRYTDHDLIEMLRSVGLWRLFKDKQGLQTVVGEGGMTLSGGQRQRLNFANLYLRAQTYKPAIILIDEPTSSLDEISEQKITEMIKQLAEDSLTLVIAHRLKTLEYAQKVMDFCLLAERPQLEFYSHNELMAKSPYYQRLIEGTVALGE